MNIKRPKQHTHNWVWKLTEFHWQTEMPKGLEYLAKYSPGGFQTRRYWACVKGGKIKHTKPAPTVGSFLERPFFAASGVDYVTQKQNMDLQVLNG